MKLPLKTRVRLLLVGVAHRFGSEIIDQRTGKSVGRAFLIPWKGRVLVMGLNQPVRPIFLPENSVRHGRQFIGFETHPEPDFPHEPHP